MLPKVSMASLLLEILCCVVLLFRQKGGKLYIFARKLVLVASVVPQLLCLVYKRHLFDIYDIQ